MGSCISSPAPPADISEEEKVRSREIDRQLKEVRRRKHSLRFWLIDLLSFQAKAKMASQVKVRPFSPLLSPSPLLTPSA